MLEELLKQSQGTIQLVKEDQLFEKFESTFIQAETDPFGVKVWTDRIKKPFPVSTLPAFQLSRIATRFPEGAYLIVLKFDADPSGLLHMLQCNSSGLPLVFEQSFEEFYLSDLSMTWLLSARRLDDGMVELVGAGEVCPIR
ncbi:MAG: hypothetical protein MUF42_11435 [Cytophagaceae bacterium]|nr:hypothetical protein [Cytophagaceae bacterium]